MVIELLSQKKTYCLALYISFSELFPKKYDCLLTDYFDGVEIEDFCYNEDEWRLGLFGIMAYLFEMWG